MNHGQSVPQASSITHQHLLSTIATEMQGRSTAKVVDVGCGSGALIKYLRAAVTVVLPNCATDVSGFDVSDFAPHGNTNLACGTLTVKTGEPWPYANQSVDVIVSNQVLEHVFDKHFFFGQIARCLKPDGVSIHLFPLKNVIYEDHVGIPLAHRIPRPGWIRLMAKLGFFSAVRAHALPGGKAGDFGECAAAYLKKYTTYASRSELKHVTRSVGLSLSFDYTPRFYQAKLRAMCGKEPVYFYPKNHLFDHAAFWLARYVAGITLVLRIANRIRRPDVQGASIEPYKYRLPKRV